MKSYWAKRLLLVMTVMAVDFSAPVGFGESLESLSDGPGTNRLAAPTTLEPQINGPCVTGATPGRPFLFKIPATGMAELTYAAKGLPRGLVLDSKSGVIMGSLAAPGVTVVTLRVGNSKGLASRKLVIVGGEGRLALTPPMGWNSWNCWATAIDQEKARAAADEFIATGLAAHGYAYVNIDDCWEGKRDAAGMIQPNEKFPAMKALGDYIHSKGLKFGIYSSPGPRTCGGYTGSYQHEDQDVQQWAYWGVDYIKYDWCSFDEIAHGDRSKQSLVKPYRVLRQSLDKVNRDIVYSLCCGFGRSWEWSRDPGIRGNCWRTTDDINDSWRTLRSIGFSQNGHETAAGPGHWNDPDMLVVGKLGWGPRLHATRLTRDEQLTHLSLWSILAAPLLIGCDMTQMDEFTLNLLTNDEVLDVDQDPMGQQGRMIFQSGDEQVWARQLWDGTVGVGLFNLASAPAQVTVKWSDLGLQSPMPVRDLWMHKNLGKFDSNFSAEVPRHGVVLLKIGTPISESKAVKKLVAQFSSP